MSTVSLRSQKSILRTVKDALFATFISISIVFALGFIIFVFYFLYQQSAPAWELNIMDKFPSARPQNAGIQSGFWGSFWVVGIAAVMSIPIGILAGLYLEEFAKSNRVTRFIDLTIRNLAGVPAVVFGMIGLAFIARGPLSWGFSVGTAAAVLAMLILPVIIIVTREALRAVPPSFKEGALALGATPFQAMMRLVLPHAMPGIATGSILSVSRAMGESAPLLLLGALAFVTFNPEGLDSDYTVLPLLIFRYTSDAREEFHAIAAATSLILMALLFLMNLIAIIIRDRSQRKRN